MEVKRSSGTRFSQALVPLLLYIGLVTAVISSLGAPLLPLMASHYGVSLGQVQWSLTSTVLAGAATAPIMGRLSDGPHRRAVIIGSLAAVTAGSVLVAATNNFTTLIIGRALQGLGLGLVAPAMATARDRLPGAKSQNAIATLSIIAPAGVGLGYPLSAWLAEHASLSASFWFGAVVAGLALVAAIFVLPPSTATQRVQIDVTTSLSLMAGLLGLLIALSDGGTWGWSSAQTLLLLAVGIVALVTWVTRELHAATPLLNLRLLVNPRVRAANVCVLVMGAAMYTMMTALTDFIQTPRSVGFGFGATPIIAGLLLLPSSIVMLAANRARLRLSRHVPDRWLVPAGTVVVALASTIFATAHSGLWAAFLTMTVSGFGLGITFAALPGLVVTNVPIAEVGSALGLYTVVRFVGYSLGSALAAFILSAYTHSAAQNPEERGYVMVLIASIALSFIAAMLTALSMRAKATLPCESQSSGPLLGTSRPQGPGDSLPASD